MPEHDDGFRRRLAKLGCKITLIADEENSEANDPSLALVLKGKLWVVVRARVLRLAYSKVPEWFRRWLFEELKISPCEDKDEDDNDG